MAMRWFLVALWMAVIFVTSCTVISRPAFVHSIAAVLPGAETRDLWGRFWDSCGLLVVKGYHTAEFAVLFLLVRSVLRERLPRRAIAVGIAISVLFAASDEWHQTFVRGRGGTLSDVAIDTVGVLLAATLVSRRSTQVCLIVSTLAISWLGMMIVHEGGHVLAAWLGGETVQRVVLHPLAFSRTDATHDRHPLLLIWGGPLIGTVVPLIVLAVVKWSRAAGFYLFQFFAGFCLIANGAYLAVGSFTEAGDAGDLVCYGCPKVLMIAFGLLTDPLGLYLWNGLGPHFGLGRSTGRVSRTAASATLVILAAIVVVELLSSCRG
jgi:VanZ like family